VASPPLPGGEDDDTARDASERLFLLRSIIPAAPKKKPGSTNCVDPNVKPSTAADGESVSVSLTKVPLASVTLPPIQKGHVCVELEQDPAAHSGEPQGIGAKDNERDGSNAWLHGLSAALHGLHRRNEKPAAVSKATENCCAGVP